MPVPSRRPEPCVAWCPRSVRWAACRCARSLHQRSVRLAGVEINALQAYIFGIVAPIYPRDTGSGSPGTRARHCGVKARCFISLRSPARWTGSPTKGDAPFYLGELADRLVSLCQDQVGTFHTTTWPTTA